MYVCGNYIYFFKYLILQYGVSNMRTAIFDYLRKVLGGPPGHAI